MQKFIFDLDGTLYRFRNNGTFSGSQMNIDIQKNILHFLEHELGVPHHRIQTTCEQLKNTYGEHMSIALEKEYGVDRFTYFSHVWDLNPEKYIDPTTETKMVLEQIQGRFAVLTNAPRIWAERVLRFLSVYEFAQKSLFTGETDIRKPTKEAFRRVGEFLGGPFEKIYAVGDQLETDILPAQAIGMKSTLIGKTTDKKIQTIDSLSEFLTRFPN